MNFKYPGTMQEPTIDLHLRANDFREIFYADGKGNFFSWQNIKREVFYAGGFAMAAALIYLSYKKSFGLGKFIFLFIALTLMIIFIIRVFINISRFNTWKGSIEKWIKAYTKYPKNKLALHPAFMEFVQGENALLENWQTIKTADFKNHSISITGLRESYIFPAKSMRPDEFELLKNSIRDKLKNTILKEPGVSEK